MFRSIKRAFEPAHVKQARKIFDKRKDLIDRSLDSNFIFTSLTLYEAITLQTQALVDLINPTFAIGSMGKDSDTFNTEMTKYVLMISEALIRTNTKLRTDTLIKELLQEKDPTPTSDIEYLFETDLDYCDVTIDNSWPVQDIFTGTIANTFSESEKKRLVFCIAGLLVANKKLSEKDRLILAHMLVLRSEKFEQLIECSLF